MIRAIAMSVAFAATAKAALIMATRWRVAILVGLFAASAHAELVVTPSTLTFPAQAFQTSSAPQSIVVTNQGAAPAPVSITWLTCNAEPDCAVPDQHEEFSLISYFPCSGGTLAPGASCTIGVSFRPRDDGLRRAALAVGGTTVSVTGTGFGALMRVEPSRLFFPAQPVGVTSPVQTATVTNLDSVTHELSMYVVGCVVVGFEPCGTPGWNDFALTPTCTVPVSQPGYEYFASLPPGGSCTLSIAFTPSGSGRRYGRIMAYANGTLWFDMSVQSSGEGIDAEGTTRLSHISARGKIGGASNDVLIAGFVVGGLYPKTVIVRARGPSLGQYGIQNPLANPAVQLVRMSDAAVIASNDNYAAGYARYRGFVPSDSREAYVEATLPPGAYTAIVSGVGGATGIATAEVFEVDRTESPFVNLSVRGLVGTGEDVLIAGIAVDGPTSRTVVIRARGPSLTAFGIDSALADPALYIVRSSDQAIIASNDNWGDDRNAAQVISSGLAPASALEPAIYITLPPGLYTAIVSGVGRATGTATVEVFAK